MKEEKSRKYWETEESAAELAQKTIIGLSLFFI